MTTKFICLKCAQDFHLNMVDGFPMTGVIVVEFNYAGPYKIWAADEFICRGCGCTIVAGFGDKPIAVAHNKNFAEIFKNIKDSPLLRLCFESTAQRLSYEEQQARQATLDPRL